MPQIYYIDRIKGQREKEEVYGASFLRFLYGRSFLSRFLAAPLLLPLVVKIPLFSSLVGYWYRRKASRKQILPFIQKFGVDSSEFLDSIDSFKSFNDFFCRRLKPSARPIDSGAQTAVIPADGRYYFYQEISQTEGFIVKGQKFKLSELIQSPSLAEKYEKGSMVMARLCPTDYHRYHFPCECVPNKTQLINGWLYSVNPIAIRQNVNIFTQNKRTLCELHSETFGKVLFLEIGATSVGSINQTYVPYKKYAKGDEKGFFAFGGSAIIMLFEPNVIEFDQDLVNATRQGIEILCLMGQSMGERRH